jgi:hypothetical protein
MVSGRSFLGLETWKSGNLPLLPDTRGLQVLEFQIFIRHLPPLKTCRLSSVEWGWGREMARSALK